MSNLPYFSGGSTFVNPKLQLLHLSLNVRCGQGLIVDIFDIGKDSGGKSHLAVSVCSRCSYTQAKALETVNSTTVSKFIIGCLQVQIPQFLSGENARYFVSGEAKKLFVGLNGGLKKWRDEKKKKS